MSSNKEKIRVALLCPQLIKNHPAGEVTLTMVRELCDEIDFTIYGSVIDSELLNSGKIKFIRLFIPIIKPRVLTYIVQYFIYWFSYHYYFLRKFDIIHSIEAVAPRTHVMSMHYCGHAAKELTQKKIISYKGWRKAYYAILDHVGCYFEYKICHNKILKKLVAVSEGLREEILHYDRPNVEVKVIPNYVEPLSQLRGREEFRRSYGIDTEDQVGLVVALGDWERKGLSYIIEAYNKLNAKQLKLFVVGSGPVERYKQMVSNSIKDNILFVGFRTDIANFYAASDFFILASAYESWSLVGFQAALSGLAVLTTKVNGIGDVIINGENGLIITREANNIADRLGLILAGQAASYGMKIQPVAQQFTKSKMIESYKMLYYNLKHSQ